MTERIDINYIGPDLVAYVIFFVYFRWGLRQGNQKSLPRFGVVSRGHGFSCRCEYRNGCVVFKSAWTIGQRNLEQHWCELGTLQK